MGELLASAAQEWRILAHHKDPVHLHCLFRLFVDAVAFLHAIEQQVAIELLLRRLGDVPRLHLGSYQVSCIAQVLLGVADARRNVGQNALVDVQFKADKQRIVSSETRPAETTYQSMTPNE